MQPGKQLSHYEVLEAIGKGGMGEVWRARDTKLGREVAIKTLPPEFAEDPDRLARFEREAKLLASLNHPNIAGIYGLEEHEGSRFLVLELIEGDTLADRLRMGSIPVEESLKLAVQIAEALEAAHESGVIHRDLKPANIKVTPSGRVKVLDFGLAKHQVQVGDDTPTASLSMDATRAGQVMGTVAYMSPEQAEGREIDTRSDIFSFGVVLYEMLCGQRPFEGGTPLSTLAAVLRDSPGSPHAIKAEVPESLGQVVLKCLEKTPESRFATALTLREALESHQTTVARSMRRGPLAAAAAVILVGLAVVFGWPALRDSSRVTWAEEEAIPEIDRLLTVGQPYAAQQLYREAEIYIPASRGLRLFDDALRPARLQIETQPPGAAISLTDYSDPASEWQSVGTSPLDLDGIPIGYYRVRADLEGYASVEWATSPGVLSITLQQEEVVPEGMVWVPGPEPGTGLTLGVTTPEDPLGDFWLGEHEVTNSEYQAFVDAGGYETREYWNEPFVREGVTVGWDEALALFVDTTGRPGPATWEFGAYPEGEGSFPVSGVSWYEAMAFAEFSGMRLPTAYHWYSAAGANGFFGGIVQFSNFSGTGPQEVGVGSISPFGARDMAGNVKEWVVNADSAGLKYTLGGGWNEPNYTFINPDARRSFDRDATFGFRLAMYSDNAEADLTGPVTRVTAGPAPPVDDETFSIYRAQLAYDRVEPDVRVEARESSGPFVRQETLWLQLPGGEERILAHVFVPAEFEPPYQVVTMFGSAAVTQTPSIDQLRDPFLFLVRLGRAVVIPVFNGTLERGPLPLGVMGPNQARDYFRDWSEDLGRTLDYLETRPDEFDSDRIAYMGQSFGAIMAPTLLVAEPRVKAAVFLSGGSIPLRGRGPMPVPVEVHPSVYAPRLSIPVLMLNGHDDYITPHETSQLPLYGLLGSPEEEKDLVLFDGGHVNLLSNMDLVRRTVDWLDTYVGPVNAAP